MKINHVAVYTNDLERLRMFYEKYFCGKANEKYHNPKTGLETYFLTFDDGIRLEIMTRPNLITRQELNPCIGLVHLAFSAGSKENVDRLTKELTDNGVTLLSAPRTTGDGYYESCVADPDMNQIEIVE